MKAKQSRWAGLRASALAVTLLLTPSCQIRLAMWIMPGSRAHNLVFGISEHRDGTEAVRLSSLEVFRCSDISAQGDAGSYPCPGKEVWKLRANDSVPGPGITRIVYGRAPRGIEVSSPPGALEVPGCYIVLAYAFDSRGHHRFATVGFRVLGDGSVQEMSRREYDRVFAARRPELPAEAGA